MTAAAIEHRLRQGRLHRVHRGVYAVGRPDLTLRGRWMAAVLACGPGATLSHRSAGQLWGLLRGSAIRSPDVTVPGGRCVRRPGIDVHRRYTPVTAPNTHCDRIPVTSPAQTLVDIAPFVSPEELETAVNEADKRDLVPWEALSETLARADGRQPGVVILRKLLDRESFTLTDSHLERLFLPIARRAGPPNPAPREWVNGFRVDFFFPDLGLVVEADGLRYHRTPAAQARDRLRDQAHIAAGLTPLRFTHWQVAHRPGYVEETLRATGRRLAERARAARASPAR
jgi:hypothetical protein